VVSLTNFDDVNLFINIDPGLHHSDSVWTISQECWRHYIPTQGFGELECGDFSLCERAMRKVPERSFAPSGLVDDIT
jgi:hypothetical protein